MDEEASTQRRPVPRGSDREAEQPECSFLRRGAPRSVWLVPKARGEACGARRGGEGEGCFIWPVCGVPTDVMLCGRDLAAVRLLPCLHRRGTTGRTPPTCCLALPKTTRTVMGERSGSGGAGGGVHSHVGGTRQLLCHRPSLQCSLHVRLCHIPDLPPHAWILIELDTAASQLVHVTACLPLLPIPLTCHPPPKASPSRLLGVLDASTQQPMGLCPLRTSREPKQQQQQRAEESQQAAFVVCGLRKRNVGAFLNHSCDPNIFVQVGVSVGGWGGVCLEQGGGGGGAAGSWPERPSPSRGCLLHQGGSLAWLHQRDLFGRPLMGSPSPPLLQPPPPCQDMAC